MRNRKGFTLVEIMIVVAIIALLAAIAIPNLVRARLNANESATIAALKSVTAAANSFASVNNASFPADLAALSTAVPPYLDATFTGAPVKSGYTLTYTAEAAVGGIVPGFRVNAEPTTRGQTGSRGFYIDEAGVICASVANEAAKTVTHTCGKCTGTDVAL